jgi:hypothetical protein
MIRAFTIAVFLGAWLLFMVQPMAGKMLLPQLGGSPAVWNACMLFFQTLLLAGYAYAHLISRSLGRRAQVLVHGAVLLLAIPFLPLRLLDTGASPSVESPTTWLLARLFVALGLPFLAAAATGPLMQRWFSMTDHKAAGDPYFLYAASNVGSLGALLAYPLLVETTLRLATPGESLLPPSLQPMTQNLLWSLGYIALAISCVACGVLLLRRPGAEPVEVGPDSKRTGTASRAAWPTRLLWLALAFVPSSAMLATTQELTTDIAAVPLLWVLPLALYLATFVLAFTPRLRINPRVSGLVLGLLCLLVAGTVWLEVRPAPQWAIPLYLATLFFIGLVAHDRLARSRPAPEGLTGFYLWIALGGALGGLFNTLVAPLLFDSVVEFPLALFLGCLLVPQSASGKGRSAARRRWLDLLLPALLALAVVGLHALSADFTETREHGLRLEAIAACLLGALLVVRPLRFALGLAVLLVAASFYSLQEGEVIHAERTFFGVLRVKSSPVVFRVAENPGDAGEIVEIAGHNLFHGTTRHGRQMRDPELRFIPGSYYHRSGPIGRVFEALQGTRSPSDVAIIGLGAGCLAAYGRPGQRFVFFELDPAVERIARDPALFTYLEDSRAELSVRLGDGRILLEREPDAGFDLLIVDGFTSDAIPVHLLTREALELYIRKLRPDGLVALHLSNSHFDLLPVVRAVAADLGLAGLSWDDRSISPLERVEGKSHSLWAVVARDEGALQSLRARSEWKPLRGEGLEASDRRLLWTDDYSSPLLTLK